MLFQIHDDCTPAPPEHELSFFTGAAKDANHVHCVEGVPGLIRNILGWPNWLPIMISCHTGAVDGNVEHAFLAGCP